MAGFSSLFARTQGGGGLGANVGFRSIFARSVGGGGFASAGPTVDISASDTISVSVTEGPVDAQEVASFDLIRVSVGEAPAQLFNHIGLTDAINISLSETIGLVISGVTPKVATDTISVSVSDTATVDASVDATDTISITLSAEDATVDVLAEAISATDTISVSVSEDLLREIFTGIVEHTATDTISISLSGEVAARAIIVQAVTPQVKHISLEIISPRIELEIL